MFEQRFEAIKAEIDGMNLTRKNIRQKIAKERKRLAAELSRYDSYQSDLLHYLEFEPCDAVTSAKIMKTLKTNRKNRRVIKDQINRLNSMTDKLKNNVNVNIFEKPKNKKYSYRVANPNNIFEMRD